MLVYRVESSRNGLGPYNNTICSWRHYGDECPSPRDDGINQWELTNPYYGFKSKRDLVLWFGKDWIKQSESKNHYIYAYRVCGNVSLGRKHLAFSRHKAYKIRRIYPYEL